MVEPLRKPNHQGSGTQGLPKAKAGSGQQRTLCPTASYQALHMKQQQSTAGGGSKNVNRKGRKLTVEQELRKYPLATHS